jgi:hypothetical protein
MRRLAVTVALAAAALILAPSAIAAPTLAKVGDFDSPVHVASPPGDPRLFVVEQDGLVKVIDGGRERTFLDMTTLVNTSGSERGLLSIAFPPDYATSGLSYVYLTVGDQVQVYEHRPSADPDVADPATRRLVLSIPHTEAGNHNGGQLAFGPDGLLYVGVGDGGNSNDTPTSDAENPASLLGKILRIDPRGAAQGAHGVPQDNPFHSEVWAYGLRNPWRFSFDRATGDLVIGDVGQAHREEIDFAPASAGLGRGANFGWHCWEGTVRTTLSTGQPEGSTPLCADGDLPANPVFPVIDFTHSGDGFCSITGGFVVRDPGLPTLAGRYVYGDFCRTTLRSVALVPGSASGDRAEQTLPAQSPSSFGEDACGRVYVSMLPNGAHNAGSVYRIEDGAPTPCNPGVGAGGSGPPGGPSGGTSRPDTRKPGLQVGVTGRRSLAARRRLRVSVRADEAAGLRITGRLRGVAGLRTARRQLSAGRRAVVTVRITKKSARKLRLTLRRKRVIAALTLRARDAAGNERRVVRRVKIPRRRD